MSIGAPRGPEDQENLVEQAHNVVQALFDRLAREVDFKVSSVEDFSKEVGVMKINFSFNYDPSASSEHIRSFEKSIADAFRSLGIPVYTPFAPDVFSAFVSWEYFDEHRYSAGEPRLAMLDAIRKGDR